jgi:excinuclease ABC subunit C
LLDELAKIIGLKQTPLRIELFDNSHLQGSSAVGAMVCFINGEPSKKNYRKFRLSEEDAGDDYHSMKEVVSRRYRRLKEENSSFPDLILADGGLTQVHASLEGLDEAGVNVPVYGLYKNDKHQTEGLIDKDGKKYPLDKKSSLFFLLMRMQDEVHRFALSYHKQVRGKDMTRSLFDGIQGLGPKRIELLHAHYPSIDSLLSSSVAELSQLIPLPSAEALYKKLHEGE